MSNTTSTGTTITIEDGPGELRLVICDNPSAPADMRHCEVGRVVDGGFQPASFADWGLRPEALRIIADLIEDEAKR